uniref:Glyco_18 domain-containing protein n=1 Tax=Rhabditophanes sp. KR3021 TaxID=114890 RepID=A0AC35U6I4_9BILA
MHHSKVFQILLVILLSVGSCESSSFYCYSNPKRNERVNITVFSDINCTHIIYGSALISHDYEIETKNIHDSKSGSYYTNWESLAGLKYTKKSLSLLLDVGYDRDLSMLDTQYSRTRLITAIIRKLKYWNFDGIFLKADDYSLNEPTFDRFLTEWKNEVEAESIKLNSKHFQIVVLMRSNFLGTLKNKLSFISNNTDAVYINLDNKAPKSDSKYIHHADPLHSSKIIPEYAALSSVFKEAVKLGLSKQKLIVGLNVWSRGFKLLNDSLTHHLAPHKNEFPMSHYTNLTNGYYTLPDVCKLYVHDENATIYDADSSSTSFVGSDGFWYQSVNVSHEAFTNKIKWISSNGYGGIGLTSLQADDATNVCGQGVMPIHTLVSKALKFINVNITRGNNACTRLCTIDSSNLHDMDVYLHLKEKYCSHIVIEEIDFTVIGDLIISTAFTKALAKFEAWDVRHKPYLVVSLGNKISSVIWRSATINLFFRNKLVDNIKKFMDIHNIDGLNIAWTYGSMQMDIDGKALTQFALELKKKMGLEKTLFASISSKNSYANKYPVGEMINAVDYFILEAYKFHSLKDSVTGHHSALQKTTSDSTDETNVIDFAKDWNKRGIPPNMTIIEFTALGMEFTMDQVITKNVVDNYMGHKVVSGAYLSRLGSSNHLGQAEICEVLKNNETFKHFSSEFGVPFLVNKQQFIAYDNVKSIRMKAIWTSINQFAGTSLKSIELDNAEGACPLNKPFTLLKVLSESQVCNKCLEKNTDSITANAGSLKSGTSNERCPSQKYKTICTYRLPTKAESQLLVPEKIPHSQCDELLIDEVVLSANGTISFKDTYAEATARKFSRSNSKLPKIGIKQVVRCDMTVNEFRNLISDEKRESTIFKIVRHVKNFEFGGVELKCHTVMDASLKQNFGKFVIGLRNLLAERIHKADCTTILSVNLPMLATKVPQFYDVATLNDLDYLSVNTESITSITRSNDTSSEANEELMTLLKTIHAWDRSGINMRKIYLIIPVYANVLISSENDVKVDSQKRYSNNKHSLSQNVLCQELKKHKIISSISYDTVSNYARLSANSEVAFDTQQTLSYKLNLIMKENLGGIVFDSLNDDDYSNECKQGAYSWLMSTKKALCQ